MARNKKIQKNESVKKNPLKSLMMWVFEIAIVILFAFALVFFFGQSRTNIGQSMSVTLRGGDQVLLNELVYKFTSPSRNDIVAFKPNGNMESATSIKRVIGLPGEKIQIKEGMIYINDTIYLEELDFPVMKEAGVAKEPLVLKANEYFVLGDNRNDSEDSRFADVGIVEKDAIEGKVWFVISPKENFGIVK